VVVGSIGVVRLTEPGADDFHKYVGSTWAIKIIAAAYIRYYGYEGGPTVQLTINEDDTFSVPDQNNNSFFGVPIGRPALAQYAGVYATQTQGLGDFFSPLIINQDGTVSIGPSSQRRRTNARYESAGASVSIDLTDFRDKRFTATFSLHGTGQSINFSGTLKPRPQDASVTFTGSKIENPTEAFHEFVLTDEFPLYYDGAHGRPLSFLGPGALACTTSTSTNALSFFRLVPVDFQDSSKGYRIWCNGFYVSNADTSWLGDRCISGTTNTSSAISFKPTFPSSMLVQFNASGYVSPWTRDPPLTAPLLATERIGSARTLIVNDHSASWFTTLRKPTAYTSRSISGTKNLHSKWHYFFLLVDFPLHLDGSSYLKTTSDNFMVPGGDGSALFRLVPLDVNAYQRGYHVSCNGQYVSGTGTLQGRRCIKLSSDVQAADVFMLKIVTNTSFIIQNTITLQALSQPVDQNSQSLPSLDYVLPGESGTYSGALQVFTPPNWSLRLMQMAYLTTTGDFCLQWPSNNKYIYTTSTGSVSLSVANEIQNQLSAVVALSSQSLSSRHSGYILSIGGTKYVKFAGNNASVSLVDDIAQATPLCITRQGSSSFSLWHCMSNDVLTSPDGTSVVFTEMDDSQAVSPAWTVSKPFEHTHLASLRLAADSSANSEVSSSLDDTVHLKQIVDDIRKQQYGKKGCTWNVSIDNVLASDWWIGTPPRPFISYADFPMRIVDDQATNDFKLKVKGPNDVVDPKHPAVAINSSVTASGTTPLVLYAGHSYRLYEAMYKIITSAEKFVDIATLLDPPSGEFLAAMRNAITFLSNKSQARDVAIRLLFGAPPDYNGPSAESTLHDLVRDVTSSSSKMKVYLGYTNLFTVAWNHSKIVAADGKMALVGGHNWWDRDYLDDNPVMDVSMVLSGLAATDAHQFADCQWHSMLNVSWAPDRQVAMSTYDPTYDPKIEFTNLIKSSTMPDKTTASGFDAFPPDRAFGKAVGEQRHHPARSTGTGIPVLSVARDMSTPPGQAPSDQAIVSLITSATTSVHISAQMLKNEYRIPIIGFRVPDGRPDWDDDFLKAVAAAIVKNVSVKIYMSNTQKGGYEGTPPAEVIEQIQKRIEGKSTQEITALIAANLKVRSFPPASTWNPDFTAGVKNHAKLIVVDSRAVSIGSQNYYPSSRAYLAEFTYIFEDASKASQVITDYFIPLESWCVSPPAAPALVSIPTYKITMTRLQCMEAADEDIWPSIHPTGPNQVYLSKDSDGKIWPSDSYQTTVTGGREDINISFTVKSSSVNITVWEWDWFRDDRLADFYFDPKYFAEHVKAGQVFADTDYGHRHGRESGMWAIEYNVQLV
jgi:phosphatidylserine/phosphatidylglycerophosphate/cardiolipin synthase-like enzyme